MSNEFIVEGETRFLFQDVTQNGELVPNDS